MAAVSRRLDGSAVRVSLRADCRNGRLMRYIEQHAEVSDRTFVGATARIEAVMSARRLEMLRAFGDDVSVVKH